MRWRCSSSSRMRIASRSNFSASPAYSHCVPTLSCFRCATCPPALPLKCETHRLRLFRRDGDRLLLLTVLLVPRDERVVARGQIRNRKRAVRLRDRIERMRHHSHPGFHPSVNVAFHFEGRDLRFVEFLY